MWSEKLKSLSHGLLTKTHILDPVYFGGSKHLKQKILNEIIIENKWADVSNKNFKTLIKYISINILVDLFLNHRYDNKIYKHSNPNIILMQLVQKYLHMFSKITHFELLSIYNESCNILQTSMNEKIIIVIDCRHVYFEQYASDLNELLLNTASNIALLNKRSLYPFIEFVIIMDIDKHYNDCNIIDNLQQLLLSNLSKKDVIYNELDSSVIKKLIVAAHRVLDE